MRKIRNPEDDVLDAIDELVSETMAAGVDRFGNPLDSYMSNRYPGCPNCGHEWHGVKCAPSGIDCDCPGSEGEAEPMNSGHGAVYPQLQAYVYQVESGQLAEVMGLPELPPEQYLDPQDWVDVQGGCIHDG